MQRGYLHLLHSQIIIKLVSLHLNQQLQIILRSWELVM